MTYYLGIDPGKSGGFAILDDSNAIIDVIATPMAGRDIDLSRIHDWLTEYWKSDTYVACIEKVTSMPRQGVRSMFNFGFYTGAVHGVLAAMLIPRYEVSPTQWKNLVLKGTKKDKKAAIDLCRRIYPKESLLETERSRVPHSGMADALCIARYALLKKL